jgi:hypothetical protein
MLPREIVTGLMGRLERQDASKPDLFAPLAYR